MNANVTFKPNVMPDINWTKEAFILQSSALVKDSRLENGINVFTDQHFIAGGK